MNVYYDFAIPAFGRHITDVVLGYEFVALTTTTRDLSNHLGMQICKECVWENM
jgi:hypothetical protein